MPPTSEHVSQVPAPEVPATSEQSPLRPWLIGGGLVLAALGVALVGLSVFAPSSEDAFDPAVPKKIGVVHVRQQADVLEGFKSAMRSLGYTNLMFQEAVVVSASSTVVQDTKDAVLGMIESGVDMLWFSSDQQAKVGLETTREIGRTDIPIIFMSRLHDPVEYGLVESYASSGNNMTGVSTGLSDVVARMISFLLEMEPDIKKVGIFGKGFLVEPVGGGFYREYVRQLPRFNLELVEYTTNLPPPKARAEFDRIAASIQEGDIDALVHVPGHFYDVQEVGEYNLAKRLGIPHAVPSNDFPRGGHFAYSDYLFESGEQMASAADKVFRGTPPSEIPIEHVSRNHLLLNLERARETGVTFTDSMLYIATEKVGE